MLREDLHCSELMRTFPDASQCVGSASDAAYACCTTSCACLAASLASSSGLQGGL